MAFTSIPSSQLEQMAFLQDFEISHLEDELQVADDPPSLDASRVHIPQTCGDRQTFTEPSSYVHSDQFLDSPPVSHGAESLPDPSAVYGLPEVPCDTQTLQYSPGMNDTYGLYESPEFLLQETSTSPFPEHSLEQSETAAPARGGWPDNKTEDDSNVLTNIIRQRLFTRKAHTPLHELPPQSNPGLERRRLRAGAARERRDKRKLNTERMRQQITHLNDKATCLKRVLAAIEQQISTLEQQVSLSSATCPKLAENSCGAFWLS